MPRARNTPHPAAATVAQLETELEQLGGELFVLRRILTEVQSKLDALLAWKEEQERSCAGQPGKRRAAQQTLFS